MTFEDFNKLQLEIFDDILKMAKTKGIEYSSNKNERLANFKRLATELEISATKVGYIYFKKHLDAITTYLKDGRVYSEEGIRGRFIDAINYLTLIYGLIVDDLNGKIEQGKPDPSASNAIKGPETKFTLHGLGSNQRELKSALEPMIWTKDIQEKGPICSRCGKFIEAGQVYTLDNGVYSHRFHLEYDETSAKSETKAEDK